MPKYKMPTVQEFLQKKTIYDHKDPVWVYLEKEMLDNIAKKPYNVKVGNWLRFLRDLRYHFYCEARRKFKRLEREIGPPWYCELSIMQRTVLKNLKSNIYEDLTENKPSRTLKSLSDLGVTLKIPKNIMMKALTDCIDDPGLFIWNLYSAFYKKSPSDLQPVYDINARLLMSSLAFLDLPECIQQLEDLTHYSIPPPSIPKKKVKKYIQPNIRYGEYLQKMAACSYSNNSTKLKKSKQEPTPLGCKVRVHSDDSYERLCRDQGFLAKRKERNRKEKQSERICTYKFWEPPITLRNTDPDILNYVTVLKMLKKKAKPRFKSPYKNVQYQIGGVALVGGQPRFYLNSVVFLPTGYIHINNGTVFSDGEYVTLIHGYFKYPRDVREICEESCNCLAKWEDKVMEYTKQSKCKCGHLYDIYNTGKVTEKYFYKPTRLGPYWLDNNKVYTLDPMEDLVRDTVRDALLSREPTPEQSSSNLVPGNMKNKELLAAFLADLSDTPLIIPHLPKAYLLNNLLEWVRKRVKGDLTPEQNKKLILQSRRRWLDLSHIDARALAYRIKFTEKQLNRMNWSHRKMLQKMFKILLNDFVTRNIMTHINQTNLWWPTMKYDEYPNESFLNVFFTYMPCRMKDTFLINPYNRNDLVNNGGRTCPLSN